jgi:hypothetical protein
MRAGVAYTIATGKKFCAEEEMLAEATRLLGRPVLADDLRGDPFIWLDLRLALELEIGWDMVKEGER